MLDFLNQIVFSVGNWGYLILFIFLIIEGEGTILFFAFLTSLGYLNPYLVFLMIIFSELVNDHLWYWLGRRWGEPAVIKHGHYLGLSAKRFQWVRDHFDSHGGKTIFISKFLYGSNKVALVVAGSARMAYRKLVKYDGPTIIVWAILFFSLGYLFGQGFGLLSEYIKGAEKILLIIFLIFLSLWFLFERKIKKEVE
ncbi:MAG: DedA family protein [Patescibacteria group bacterium]